MCYGAQGAIIWIPCFAAIATARPMSGPVEASEGIGFTPPTIAAAAGRRVRFLPLDPPAAPIEIGVASRHGPAPPRSQAFIEALRTAAKSVL